MKKFYLIGSGSSSNMRMLDDLRTQKIDNFQYIQAPVKIKNNIVQHIFNFYFKINAKIKLPISKVWEKFFYFLIWICVMRITLY